MHLRPPQPRVGERRADLDPLDRLNRHQSGSELAVELAVEMDMAAQPCRHTRRHDLEHAAQRVFRLHRVPDRLAHRFGRVRVGAAEVVGLSQGETLGVGQIIRDAGVHLADAGHVAADRDAELRQVRPADRADGDAHGGLPRAGALQRRPQIAIAVLDRGGQIGVAGPRDRHGRHVLLRPRLVVEVGDLQADRCAGREPAHHPRGDADCVALDLHAAARAVGDLPPRQVAVDGLRCDRQPGDHPFQDGGQHRAVALAGGEETK